MLKRNPPISLVIAAGLALAFAACSSPATPSTTPAGPTPGTLTTPAPADPSPTAPPPTATPEPLPPPQGRRLPAGTVALYGSGPWEGPELYALGAGGLSTALGEVTYGADASPGGRWLVRLDGMEPPQASVIESLEGGGAYTVPFALEGASQSGLVGYWAFDREEARLASLEVGPYGEGGLRWSIAVVNLQDGASNHFEMTLTGDAGMLPGWPIGWSASGELLLDTFLPFSDGGWAGVWAVTLPADGASAPMESLARRQVLAQGAYGSQPRLSPDGARLLYLAGDPQYTPADYEAEGFEGVLNQLWVLDLATGQAECLVEVADGGALAHQATWSPDGRQVLFVQGRFDGGSVLAQPMLKVRDAAGTIRDVGQVPVQGYLGPLHWCRPDLALVSVYVLGSGNELYTVDLASGHTARVHTAPEADGQILWVLGCVP